MRHFACNSPLSSVLTGGSWRNVKQIDVESLYNVTVTISNATFASNTPITGKAPLRLAGTGGGCRECMMSIEIDDLKTSNEFLNTLLDNMNEAVLITDEDFRIYRFNDSFLSLFEESTKKNIRGNTFGRAMGCIHTVNEESACGETSKCDDCIIRRSLRKTMVKKIPVDRMCLDKIFYINGVPKRKFLEFTTRPIYFQGRRMVLLMLYDVTQRELQKIELKKKQDLLDQDLDAAALIQQSLLPDAVSKIKAVHIAWKFKPCSNIGGDIFNICYPDERHMGFYLLDVCGHGVFAALIAVAVSQFLKGKIGESIHHDGEISPGMVLNNLNKAFPFERFETFFSMIFMVIDHCRGVLTYGCAGHPPAVVLRKDGDVQVLASRGSVIGMDPNTHYREEETTLQPGDKILLYSDGILENRNPEGENFGSDRLYHLLNQNAQKTIRPLVHGIFKSVNHFNGGIPPEDDMSLLGIEYDG